MVIEPQTSPAMPVSPEDMPVSPEEPVSQEPVSSEETPSQERRLLYCHCAYSRVVPKDVKAEVLQGLATSGRAFDAVPDLCELAARCDPSLKKLADPGAGAVDIVACYPRAVSWLFHAADSPLPEQDVHIHNMRVDDAGTILQNLGLSSPTPASTDAPQQDAPQHDESPQEEAPTA